MKKKHFKLLTTMASLLLVVSVMAVGIWAATQQTFKLTSSISFQATGITADVYAKISGDFKENSASLASKSINNESYTHITTFAQGDDTNTSESKLIFEFDDQDEDGFLQPYNAEPSEGQSAGEHVKLSLVFVNISDANDIYFNIEAIISDIASSDDATMKIDSIKYGVATVEYTAEPKGIDEVTAAGTDIALTSQAGLYQLASADANIIAKMVTDTYTALTVDVDLTVSKKTSTFPTNSGFGLTVNLANNVSNLAALTTPADPEAGEEIGG